MSNPAESYESYMVPALFRPWAADLVQWTNLSPADRILDAACGTGIVARCAARALNGNGSVTGLDCSANMLEVARAAGAREGLRIDWREGRAEEAPFPDESFDVVFCQFALMFFSDPQKALTEAYRVLAPQGRLALSVWQSLDRHPFYEHLHNVILNRVGTSALQDIFALGDAARLRGWLETSGFRNVEIESRSKVARFPDPGGFLAGEIDVDTASIPAMQKLDDQARKAIVAAISDDMREPLRGVTKNDHVELPFHAHLVRAQR